MITPVRILVTGDRDWTSRVVIYDALYNAVEAVAPNPVILTHGDAEGADKISGWAIWDLGAHFTTREDPHPAQWYRQQNGRTFFDKGAGPKRNDEMLILKDPPVSYVLAFHNNIKASKGTKHCVLSAIRRKIHVRLHAEDGFGSYRTADIPPSSDISVPPSQAELILLDASHRLFPNTW